jgi:hypothetical protein
MDSDTAIAEALAMKMAALVGRLAAVVEWCVENAGEFLSDNPHQLGHATTALAMARAELPQHNN